MLNIVPISCNHLSELKVIDNTIYIPKHIQEECDLKETYPLSQWNYVKQKRIDSCRECNYSDYDLPFVPFKMSKMIQNSYEEGRIFVETYIDSYRFVKTCQWSPKDISETCYFDNADDALETLKKSERTSECNGVHIVLKKFRNFEARYRCFWVGEKLSFVVAFGKSSKNMVREFFEKYRYNLPLQSVCVELGYTKEFGLEIIELNAFGPDLICDPAPFNFSQDWEKIYEPKDNFYFFNL
jgi:hypothetical protein